MAIKTLPTSIITKILSFLPVKPLGRFKCVSKFWHTLLNSPNFIKLHITQTLISNNHTQRLLISHHSLSSAQIPAGNDLNFRFSDINHPLKHLSDRDGVDIIGSCNGVVCISDLHRKSVFLFNPFTKSQRLLPTFTPSPNTNPLKDLTDPENPNVVVFGFGYDSMRDDYKVLRIIQSRGRLESGVYSLRRDNWKCVNCTLPYSLECDTTVLVNENIHFVMWKYNGNKCKTLLVSFDLKLDSFSTSLELPKFEHRSGSYVFSMQDLGGCFGLMINYYRAGKGVHPVTRTVYSRRLARVDLWVLKEYGNNESWMMLFSIRDPERIGCFIHVSPVVYSKDGGRLLVELDGCSYAWYDYQSMKVEKVNAHVVPSLISLFETWVWMESLVSLEREKVKMPKKKNKKKEGKHDISEVQCKQEPTTLRGMSSDPKEDLSVRVRLQRRRSSRSDTLSEEFKLRITGDATDRTSSCTITDVTRGDS